MPYEVLNSTGISAIKWGPRDGIYIFTATVVDKDYRLNTHAYTSAHTLTLLVDLFFCLYLSHSYCNLTVTFAIAVYGTTTKSYLGYILLFLTCVLGALGLVLSYFSYRHLLKSGRLSKAD